MILFLKLSCISSKTMTLPNPAIPCVAARNSLYSLDLTMKPAIANVACIAAKLLYHAATLHGSRSYYRDLKVKLTPAWDLPAWDGMRCCHPLHGTAPWDGSLHGPMAHCIAPPITPLACTTSHLFLLTPNNKLNKNNINIINTTKLREGK